MNSDNFNQWTWEMDNCFDTNNRPTFWMNLTHNHHKLTFKKLELAFITFIDMVRKMLLKTTILFIVSQH